MAKTPSESLVNWLQHRSEHLDVLLGQVRLLSRITGVIRTALPEPLASHCHAANIDGDALVVGCSSSAWAAKLRYQTPHLLSRLMDQPNLPAFSQVRIRVQPLAKEISRTSSHRLHMSERSAALITSVANSTLDPELKAALRRLSHRAKTL